MNQALHYTTRTLVKFFLGLLLITGQKSQAMHEPPIIFRNSRFLVERSQFCSSYDEAQHRPQWAFSRWPLLYVLLE
jgi:hypothetical protein